jgi:mannose-6-phosphate isomerase
MMNWSKMRCYVPLLFSLISFTVPYRAAASDLKSCAILLTPHRLKGSIQNYSWGGTRFIPELLAIDNSSEKPHAELWIGAHAEAPSSVLTSKGWRSLTEWISENPEAVLGQNDARRFHSTLPYLFKVLDARQMLSIQAHPNKVQAEKGFALENNARIPLNDGQRNYKDNNHKPEVHVALTDFWMLHSFRPVHEIAEMLESVPAFQEMSRLQSFRRKVGNFRARLADPSVLKDLYEYVMSDDFMSQLEVNHVLDQLLGRLPTTESNMDKDHPDFWAVRAARTFASPNGNRDRGLFSIYFLNLLHLKPGQSTYQAAGVLHAYLEGTTMELMANSNNVLRGGLTPKHVAVEELLTTLTFESQKPEIQSGTQVSLAERVYYTPSQEFELSRIQIAENIRYLNQGNHGADSLIVMSGKATLLVGGQSIGIGAGEIFMVPAGLPYEFHSKGGDVATIFRATVPR